ncbi:putative lipoprotein [Hyphomonas neptunium ATCC 15444]|uniref:Putative lipoprotein n=2 Tax=Hyphomonas TaxID=85 RepID=Q0C3S9_HYPNA|nr:MULTISPECIES: hypothetical protein [Hyphomonas]ABI77179.1 putative lipoprotein [Hyphomonas neptunium ATCC 15444]KCZ96175.1 putative lipoprotein [Hyphomonas hirschiana VP5]
MSIIRYLPAAAGLVLAACASGTTSPTMRWSASAWNGLAAQTIGTDNYSFFAAPLDGEGFKLKLTLATDGAFRIQEGEDTFPEELQAAAEQAAPEGCRLDTLTLAADGSAEAAYDCQT